MSGSIEAVLFGLTCATALWLLLLCIGARLGLAQPSLAARLGIGLGALLLLFVPLAGLPLWMWLFSFCSSTSLPLLGLVCAGLWRRLCGVAVFTASEWTAAWVFGAIAGTVLYLHPFCIESFDLYNWGWHDGVAAWTIAGTAVGFLGCGSRVGVLFAGALVAYATGALASHNGWDYVIDPLYWMVSCGVLATRAAKRHWKRRDTPAREAA